MLLRIKELRTAATSARGKGAASARRLHDAFSLKDGMKSLLESKPLDHGMLDEILIQSSSQYNYFVEQVSMCEDPKNGIEEEYHVKNDRVFCWRALRTFAGERLSLFKNLHDGSVVEFTKRVTQNSDGGEIDETTVLEEFMALRPPPPKAENDKDAADNDDNDDDDVEMKKTRKRKIDGDSSKKAAPEKKQPPPSKRARTGGRTSR